MKHKSAVLTQGKQRDATVNLDTASRGFPATALLSCILFSTSFTAEEA